MARGSWASRPSRECRSRCGLACQTPSVRCADATEAAGAPASTVGREAARRGSEGEVDAAEGAASQAAAVPQRGVARDHPRARGGVEAQIASLLPDAEARLRARVRAVRVPAHPL